MNRFKQSLFTLLLAPNLCLFGADWLTDGGNSQRTNWQKDEKALSTSTAKNMTLLWKMKLDSEPKP